MLTFIKLGGSLITDKRVEGSFRQEIVQRLAHEVAEALDQNTNLSILIGHGSGSFGHFAAKRHGTMEGVHTQDQWKGLAEVATIAAELNYLVAKEFYQAGVPVWRIQPSVSALSSNGQLIRMELHTLQTALSHGIVPLVYGDVCLDDVRGGTIISTEIILSYLAQHLPVKQILLLGEVPGVLDGNGMVIPLLTPSNIQDYEHVLGGSEGTDVTGGMLTKVKDMVALVNSSTDLTIRIIDGRQQGLLQAVLTSNIQAGTLIHKG